MDDLVKAALLKWPRVPACHGWLGLDARGQWWMRDAQAQSLGAFASGPAGSKGSMLRHDKLIDFIGRNYEQESQGPYAGAWYFQNGPQKVYVELEITPWIWRLSPAENANQPPTVRSHTGLSAPVTQACCDEHGWLFLITPLGIGLVHSQDVALAAAAIESEFWPLEQVPREKLLGRQPLMPSPQAHHASLAQPSVAASH